MRPYIRLSCVNKFGSFRKQVCANGLESNWAQIFLSWLSRIRWGLQYPLPVCCWFKLLQQCTYSVKCGGEHRAWRGSWLLSWSITAPLTWTGICTCPLCPTWGLSLRHLPSLGASFQGSWTPAFSVYWLSWQEFSKGQGDLFRRDPTEFCDPRGGALKYKPLG